MQLKTTLKAGSALILPFMMAACSDRGDNAVATPPPGPPPAASFQSQFGASFAGFFDTGNTTEAKEPAQTDLPPLSNSTNPIDG